MSKTKSILFILVFAIAIAMLSVTVNAAETEVFSIEANKYDTFEEAMTAAKNGDTIKVEKDYSVEDSLGTVNKDVTLDLNGKIVVAKGSLTGGEHQPALVVNGATLTIKSSVEGGCLIAKQAVAGKNTLNIFVKNAGTLVVESGTIQAIESSYPYAIYLALADSKANANKAIINDGTIDGGYGVVVRQYDELTVNGGTIYGHRAFAVSGNGNDKEEGTIITVNGGSLIAEETVYDDFTVAIYCPGKADVTLNGGSLKGQTGIEVRAGSLNIPSNSTVIIEGTATPATFEPNGSGSTINGAGIAVSQHTTKYNLNVNVLGGEIKGHIALYEANQNTSNTKEDYEKVTINVNGGTFEATNEGAKVFYSDTAERVKPTAAAEVQTIQIHKATVVGETTSTAKYLAADSAMKLTEDGATVDLEKSESGNAYGTAIVTGDIMNVDITWGALTYICTETWDSTTHTYSYVWTATKPGTSDKITVTNHSNIDVTATFAYTPVINKVLGTFSESGKLDLDKAEGATVPQGSVTLTISNDSEVNTTDLRALQHTKIGTVTVTVVKQQYK